MRGSCLCGSVRYEVGGPAVHFVFDHCSRCRKSSGSAFAAEVLCKTSEFRWVAGQGLVSIYEAPVRKTPPGYRRAFCTVCGGPVPTFYEHGVSIPAGTLGDDPEIRPQRHILLAFKAPWFEITDQLPRFGIKPTA